MPPKKFKEMYVHIELEFIKPVGDEPTEKMVFDVPAVLFHIRDGLVSIMREEGTLEFGVANIAMMTTRHYYPDEALTEQQQVDTKK